MDQTDLFEPDDGKRKRRSRAPEFLSPPQHKRLAEWAEMTVPWLSRGAFGTFETLDSQVAECLEYWRGRGDLRADWVATIQNRIRTVERRGLTYLARRGDEAAGKALRDPVAWAQEFDRRAALDASVTNAPFEPADDTVEGGQVLSLEAHRRR